LTAAGVPQRLRMLNGATTLLDEAVHGQQASKERTP
jgi:hypothetical protein